LQRYYFSKKEIYILVGVWSFVFGFLLFTFLGPNYYEGESPKSFKIRKGETFSVVAYNLYRNGFIANPEGLKIAGFFLGAETKIKSGTYLIPSGLNYFQLVSLLIKGTPGKQIRITIPEGIWQHKLAELLQKKLNINKDEFMMLSSNKSFLKSLNIKADNLEGYLLPETYYFYEKTTVVEVIKRLKTAMDKIFEADSVKIQMKKLGLSKKEILTMASIVDGESNKKSEFKLIASVYYNRLKRGMKLQADPTIQYLKRTRRSRNKVYYKDLEIDSPYNTYKYGGLPPGPINNPGKDAILAALFPAETNYLFFVADGTGGHKFSSKLSEHNKNVRAYRRWRKSQ